MSTDNDENAALQDGSLGQAIAQSLSQGDQSQGKARDGPETVDSASASASDDDGSEGKAGRKGCLSKKKKVGLALLMGFLVVTGLAVGLSVGLTTASSSNQAYIGADPCEPRRNLVAPRGAAAGRPRGGDADAGKPSGELVRRRLIRETLEAVASGVGAGTPLVRRRRMTETSAKSSKGSKVIDVSQSLSMLTLKSAKSSKGSKAIDVSSRPTETSTKSSKDSKATDCVKSGKSSKSKSSKSKSGKGQGMSFSMSASMCMSLDGVAGSGPTDPPTAKPTGRPTDAPTNAPTDGPTDRPTDAPTDGPTDLPTTKPTGRPTDAPTDGPTDEPTDEPTDPPKAKPTDGLTSASTEDQSTKCGPVKTCPGGTSCVFIPIPFPMYDCLSTTRSGGAAEEMV